MPASPLRSWCAFGTLALAAALISGGALAQVPVLPSEPTNLASSVDRMISYRHQEHMWQTADGALHLMINRGRLEPDSRLTLYSSFDGGSSWLAMHNWPDAGLKSTSDGTLRGDLLKVAYSTAAGSIVYADLRYDAATKSWTLIRSETVLSSGVFTAENPTIGIDGVGTIWSAFVTTEVATGKLAIRLFGRVEGASAWVDTGLTFGISDGNGDIARSARLITLPNRMAMLYKVEETLFWATHDNGLPLTAPWVESTLFTSPPPAPKDPYASHFSVVADSVNNLHLVMADDNKLRYWRYNGRTATWGAPRVLDNTARVSYCQIGFVGGDTLAVAYNDGAGDSRMIQSKDRGKSFAPAALLHPGIVPDGNYDYSRLEMPAVSTNPLSVLRQFSSGSIQQLMLFTVQLP